MRKTLAVILASNDVSALLFEQVSFRSRSSSETRLKKNDMKFSSEPTLEAATLRVVKYNFLFVHVDACNSRQFHVSVGPERMERKRHSDEKDIDFASVSVR